MKKAYVLEGQPEFDRLEYQSSLPEYDYRRELEGFRVPEAGSCLDAGCGSGVVSRYLADCFPKAKILGCDSSSLRIEQAEKVLLDHAQPNLLFVQGNLSQLKLPDGAFDSIVCRYVLQHISMEQITQVMLELKRCLKPGGNIRIIDADGIFSNLHPLSSDLRSQLIQIEKGCGLDFHVGRKISTYMYEAGFEELQNRADTILFTGAALERELSLMQLRFNAALPAMTQALGGELSARRFVQHYLKAIQNPGSSYFHTMFIVQGIKSAR